MSLNSTEQSSVMPMPGDRTDTYIDQNKNVAYTRNHTGLFRLNNTSSTNNKTEDGKVST